MNLWIIVRRCCPVWILTMTEAKMTRGKAKTRCLNIQSTFVWRLFAFASQARSSWFEVHVGKYVFTFYFLFFSPKNSRRGLLIQLGSQLELFRHRINLVWGKERKVQTVTGGPRRCKERESFEFKDSWMNVFKLFKVRRNIILISEAFHKASQSLTAAMLNPPNSITFRRHRMQSRTSISLLVIAQMSNY